VKLLLVQTAFIGDVVLATALIEQLHQFYPDATLDFLVRRGNESLLAGHPHLRKVLIWEKKKEKYRSLLGLIRQIRRERYDWVINCQRFASSGLLTVCSGSQTVGFDKNPFSRLFTRRVSHEFGTREHPIHEIARNLRLIEHLTNTDFVRPRLYPSVGDYEQAVTLAKHQRYVCIAPTSVWLTKQYPEHKWVELIQAFAADLTVFLLGGPGDVADCERIRAAAQHPGVQVVAGQLSFLASAALMEKAVMNYVNDSAPLHFASAVNAPVTAVFCSTLPAFGFTPVSDQHWVVETTHALSCRPCGLHGKKKCPLGHFNCANTIEVEAFMMPSAAPKGLHKE